MGRRAKCREPVITKEQFIKALEGARCRIGTNYDLARALGVRLLQIYRWRSGVGPPSTKIRVLYERVEDL